MCWWLKSMLIFNIVNFIWIIKNFVCALFYNYRTVFTRLKNSNIMLLTYLQTGWQVYHFAVVIGTPKQVVVDKGHRQRHGRLGPQDVGPRHDSAAGSSSYNSAGDALALRSVSDGDDFNRDLKESNRFKQQQKHDASIISTTCFICVGDIINEHYLSAIT